jgi:hypothetical protein
MAIAAAPAAQPGARKRPAQAARADLDLAHRLATAAPGVDFQSEGHELAKRGEGQRHDT